MHFKGSRSTSHNYVCRFVPDLEDIVEFGEMVQKADMPSEAVTAAKYVIHTYILYIHTYYIV